MTKKETYLYKEALYWSISHDYFCLSHRAPVAQLDRVLDYESRGYRFDSCRAHQFIKLSSQSYRNCADILGYRQQGLCEADHSPFANKKIDAETPPERELDLILDNYGTLKHSRVTSWLRRHPRFHLHFIQTFSSWLNLVERWFRDLTDKRLCRGHFQNVAELIVTVHEYLHHHNQKPRVFVWTASVERIMTKVAKCKEALESLH